MKTSAILPPSSGDTLVRFLLSDLPLNAGPANRTAAVRPVALRQVIVAASAQHNLTKASWSRVIAAALDTGQSDAEFETLVDTIRLRGSRVTAAVARGDRPPLKSAISTVMGRETLDAYEVVQRLHQRGWEPAAANVRQYVSSVLASDREQFERVRRGRYRVRAA